MAEIGSTTLKKMCSERRPRYPVGWPWITAVVGIVSLLVLWFIRFPSSWMNSMACWFHAPPVSVAMGTKMFVSVMLAYSEVFKTAAWLAAAPARLNVSPMCD